MPEIINIWLDKSILHWTVLKGTVHLLQNMYSKQNYVVFKQWAVPRLQSISLTIL